MAGNRPAQFHRPGKLVQTAGPRFPQGFGYTEAELLDQPFIGFIHPSDRTATSAALEKLSQGTPRLGLENRFRCEHGSYRRLAWTAGPSPDLVYAVARDITWPCQTNEKRARSLAVEPASTVTHSAELVASVCHDLQQPLTVILGHAQVLQRQLARGEVVPPERLGADLAHVVLAARRIRDMTQGLLDASLQQSGEALTLRRARTDLVALARQAVGEYALVSDLHEFLFEAEVPTLEGMVDQVWVHRILANLLTNAIKYGPDGGTVSVTVKATDGPEGKCAVLVVGDQGVGIPRDDLPHIFDRFHRATNVVGRFAGTGLGLASARELVGLHGGTISAESEEGQGSIFVVRLPLTCPTEAHFSRD